ncbi:hypothetical protein K432DRAFT_397336 [Lepidopterella palustris CBS 459.81]|uniref:Uncharacterized protein n=1 Tax=Lepidopterella palustris CBS 459.81 TaxID=1314670 RepID=A0A8E2E0X1_9PEZI|nr:hypothetical protein K432DRAFT_397336 [Lepidopterella palustris CBS 459.81]
MPDSFKVRTGKWVEPLDADDLAALHATPTSTLSHFSLARLDTTKPASAPIMRRVDTALDVRETGGREELKLLLLFQNWVQYYIENHLEGPAEDEGFKRVCVAAGRAVKYVYGIRIIRTRGNGENRMIGNSCVQGFFLSDYSNQVYSRYEFLQDPVQVTAENPLSNMKYTFFYLHTGYIKCAVIRGRSTSCVLLAAIPDEIPPPKRPAPSVPGPRPKSQIPVSTLNGPMPKKPIFNISFHKKRVP